MWQRAVDPARNHGELGERGELPDRIVDPACEAWRTGSRIPEVEGDDLVAVAVDSGEVTGVGGEVPGGEEVGAGEVVEGFPERLESQEVERVENGGGDHYITVKQAQREGEQQEAETQGNPPLLRHC